MSLKSWFPNIFTLTRFSLWKTTSNNFSWVEFFLHIPFRKNKINDKIIYFREPFYHYGSFMPTMKSSALFQDGPKEFGPYAVVWDWRPHRVPIVPEMTQLFGGKHFDVNGNQFYYRLPTNLPLLWWRTKIFLLLGAFHLQNKRKNDWP